MSVTETAQVSPEAVAAWVYGCTGPVVALAGAQAAIQLVPRLSAADRAAVLAPNYNQRATALTAQGWEVDATADLNAMVGADLAVVVNPNNPDGRRWPVWWERSGGKGRRLGFVLAAPKLQPASAPFQDHGRGRTSDRHWDRGIGRCGLVPCDAQAATCRRDPGCPHCWMQTLNGAQSAPLRCLLPLKPAMPCMLRPNLRARVWTRAFSYSAGWLRLGLPGAAIEKTGHAAALTADI